jgi:hypothetical protein
VEEDPVNVLVHLFEPDVFAAKNLTDEDSALVPTDVTAVVYLSLSELFGVVFQRYLA